MVVGYMLKKLIEELNELNRMAQLYYNEEQWALLEMVNKKIMIWSNMINNNLKSERLC